PSPGIHGDGMRSVELAGSTPFLAPDLDEFSVFGKLHDARVAGSAVSVGHENVPVGRHHHVRRMIECVRALAGYSRLAQRQHDLALGTEFDHLVSLAIFSLGISNPYVAPAVDKDAVGKNK